MFTHKESCFNPPYPYIFPCGVFSRLLLLMGRRRRFAVAECELPIFFSRLISIGPQMQVNSLHVLHCCTRTCTRSRKFRHPIRSLSVYPAFTRTLSRNMFTRLYFFDSFSDVLIGSWPFCHFDLEGRDFAGSVFP